MLAFVLAFTFSMAATQNDKRKQGVLDEANAIGTAYLRTELLPAEEGAVLRQQLSEYVNERLRAVDQSNLASAPARSVELHAQMWAQVAAAARKDANTDIKKLEKDGTSEDICKSAEDEVQNLTNAYIKKIDELLAEKEVEIMKV